jgi:hypothetical protein
MVDCKRDPCVQPWQMTTPAMTIVPIEMPNAIFETSSLALSRAGLRIYVRMFRGTHMMSERSFRSYGSWVLITFIMWVIAQ